mmetsp:Transcript_87860/g.246732  ORF Transcript_87860/g.246732 Transcript_87860/m.246732 type:complete len:488 (+) Transcript_87860:192-1655(+)
MARTFPEQKGAPEHGGALTLGLQHRLCLGRIIGVGAAGGLRVRGVGSIVSVVAGLLGRLRRHLRRLLLRSGGLFRGWLSVPAAGREPTAEVHVSRRLAVERVGVGVSVGVADDEAEVVGDELLHRALLVLLAEGVDVEQHVAGGLDQVHDAVGAVRAKAEGQDRARHRLLDVTGVMRVSERAERREDVVRNACTDDADACDTHERDDARFPRVAFRCAIAVLHGHNTLRPREEMVRADDHVVVGVLYHSPRHIELEQLPAGLEDVGDGSAAARARLAAAAAHRARGRALVIRAEQIPQEYEVRHAQHPEPRDDRRAQEDAAEMERKHLSDRCQRWPRGWVLARIAIVVLLLLHVVPRNHRVGDNELASSCEHFQKQDAAEGVDHDPGEPPPVVEVLFARALDLQIVHHYPPRVDVADAEHVSEIVDEQPRCEELEQHLEEWRDQDFLHRKDALIRNLDQVSHLFPRRLDVREHAAEGHDATEAEDAR